MRRPVRRLVLVLTAMSLLLTLLPPPSMAGSTEILVTTTFDDAVPDNGTCSLREALQAVNTQQAYDACPAGSPGTVLRLGAETYTLTIDGDTDNLAGDLHIHESVTILGAGENLTIIDASELGDRPFHVISGTLTLTDLTVQGGITETNGGAILNEATLELERVTIRYSVAGNHGGGIASDGGSLTIIDSLVLGNSAQRRGGGIAIFDSTATIERTTIAENSIPFVYTDVSEDMYGGGIYNGDGGSVTLVNTTISSNTTEGDGAGVYNDSDSGSGPPQMSMVNVTVFGNTAAITAGGVNNFGVMLLLNTVIAGNQALDLGESPDCRALPGSPIESLGPNLIQSLDGCEVTGQTEGVLLSGIDPLLSPELGDFGGGTLTHLPQLGSPLIDAGSNAGCPAVDQRGVPRPIPAGGNCDIGAVEAGPVTIQVTTTDDDGPGSFRQALVAANASPGHDTIEFDIPGAGVPVINLLSPLPEISDSLTIDGTTQAAGEVVLNGEMASEVFAGLTLSADDSVIQGLGVSGFSGHGIAVMGFNNRITLNTITGNSQAGVFVIEGSGNTISQNQIDDNGGLGIDIGELGPDLNDIGDTDEAPNNGQNSPVIIRATPESGGVRIEGRINSSDNTTLHIEFYSSPTCDPTGFGEGLTFIGETTVETGPAGDFTPGNASFDVLVPAGAGIAPNQAITATATGPDGSTSEFSQCAILSPNNDSWVTALTIQPNGPSTHGFITATGQSRWYKFDVQPNSKIVVTLTDLPANYDLTLYKDINEAFEQITTNEDLARLGAEFAPDAFSPDAFSPDAFSPDAFSPDAFSPDAFSPDAFSPDAFSPDAFSPDAFSPDAFSPDAFSPDAFSPDAFSPDAFSPDAFSPDAFSPDAFSPDAFSSAQLRSIIGVSAFNGTASEGIVANTWDNDGDFYIRVRGRNGAFDLTSPFQLDVFEFTGVCVDVSPELLPPISTVATAGNYQTVILTDLDRMDPAIPGNDQATKDLMWTRLQEFANRDDVRGVIVDVGADARVAAANSQADANPECPYAKNLVASAIEDIVDSYAALNPLEYVQIVGNDDVIPFFRHPDGALLANEKNYSPPVLDQTSSQASLRLGYVLSQDRYGSAVDISLKSGTLPVPGLAVGRLVETAAEVTGMLDAYLSTTNGLVSSNSALVTGYDFLEDAALAVAAELEAGLGVPPDTLIAPRDASPLDPRSWTADQLREALLGERHDLIYLAGHFSASSALAADYRTRMLAIELVNSPVDLTNAIIFSGGCHSGYNIVDPHGVPGVTAEPDWAQAFSIKRANLIAGTGYQYGDTDFIEYGERLYLEFSRQLRAGTGPVAIGKALVEAKQEYLASTPALRGIHEKSYLIATLFGFPMLKVDLPQGRGDQPDPPSVVPGTTVFSDNPGATLGLTYADLTVTPTLSSRTVTLTDVDLGTGTPPTFEATYYVGSSGVVTNPAEPVLPLETLNVSVQGTVLRGVGFRGGSYDDLLDILPLTGASTTELRGVHPPFLSSIFYPVRTWSVNYLDMLADGSAPTWLHVMPAQYKSSAPASLTGTLRLFNELNFRLYYSNNTQTYPTSGNTPALAAPPAISSVSATPVQDSITGEWFIEFSVTVHGDPSAGVQEVWITYTIPPSNGGSGVWQSFDLTQSTDSTRWEGTLPLGSAAPEDVQFIVQAVNGVGLVNMATNQGAFYSFGTQATGDPIATSIAFESPPTSGAYGTEAIFTVQLTADGQGLPDQIIFLGTGSQRRAATTGPDGRATVAVSLLGLPGDTEILASFGGNEQYLPSSASTSFTIVKQDTNLEFDPGDTTPVTVQYGDIPGISAILSEAGGRRLIERTVLLTVEGPGGRQDSAVITDFAGGAALGPVELPAGLYQVHARFGEVVTTPGGTINLVDERYLASSASRPLEIAAESATLTISGETTVPPGMLLTLEATVTQEDDGSPGDITLAQVQLVLTPDNGGPPITVLAPVDADGNATFAVSGLSAGTYDGEASVVGGFFSSDTVNLSVTISGGSGGHVTGGGWIESPPGAYLPDPMLAGHGHFSFVAITQGQNADGLHGHVQFRLQDGDVQFTSTTLSTLFVNGSQATFSGTGTINGTGNYSFTVVVIDDGSGHNSNDVFRLTLRADDGSIVYENCPADSAQDCGKVAGGNIVVRER